MIIKQWTFSLEADEIYQSLGMGSQNTRPLVDTAILSLKEFTQNIKVQCIYTIIPVEVKEQSVNFGQGESFPVNGDYFAGASEAALAIMTVGPELEELASQMIKNGEAMEGLIVDACGTAVLDKAMSALRHEIRQQCVNQGQKLGFNLSPGGNEIPLQGQAVLMSTLQGAKIGVSLKESMLMIPVKSASVVIPIGKDLGKPNDSTDNTCILCSVRETCPNSKLRYA